MRVCARRGSEDLLPQGLRPLRFAQHIGRRDINGISPFPYDRYILVGRDGADRRSTIHRRLEIAQLRRAPPSRTGDVYSSRRHAL